MATFITESEITHMTFQVAFVGRGVIVAASDRKYTYTKLGSKGEVPQTSTVSKFLMNGSVACLMSGTRTSEALAEAIIAIPLEDEIPWRARIRKIPIVGNDGDEIIIIRADWLDRFGVLSVTNNHLDFGNPSKDLYFAGNPVTASFLAESLYNKELTVPQLENLAVLTVASAAAQHTSIGNGIDLLTLTSNGFSEPKTFTEDQAKSISVGFRKELSNLFTTHFQ
jgi:hypothetical protein